MFFNSGYQKGLVTNMPNPALLSAEYQFVGGLETRYHQNNYVNEADPLHVHTFYEIFYVFNGAAVHHVNGVKQTINDGDLVFIRKEDSHEYLNLYDPKKKFQFINLSFSNEVFDELASFLNHDQVFDDFLSAPFPTTIKLTDLEKESVMRTFKQINILPTDNLAYTKSSMRYILSGFFYKYLISRHNNKSQYFKAPDWFNELYQLLSDNRVFTKSSAEIVALSGKSREHVSRLFKQVTGKNLSQYILEQKLNYACNLLRQSDMKIIDIAFECGFENLSTFYHCFKEYFGLSPKDYRDDNTRYIIY